MVCRPISRFPSIIEIDVLHGNRVAEMNGTMWPINHVNITVRTLGGNVQLTRGMPSEIGLGNVAHHMVLSQADEEIILWIVGKLSSTEKERVIQGVFEYLDETTGMTTH